MLPGVTIGEGSIVGARSVVRQSVPAFTIVAGNPARIVRQIPTPNAFDESRHVTDERHDRIGRDPSS